MLEIGPPKVGLDDKLALLGEPLHAAHQEVQLPELLHRVVDLAREDLSRKPRVGELGHDSIHLKTTRKILTNVQLEKETFMNS